MVNIQSLWRVALLCFSVVAFVFCTPLEDVPIVTDFGTPKMSINVHKTSVIATSGDNILRLENGLFYMTNDLGETWKSLENSIGIISYVHWFKDNSCLICGRSEAYWVDSSFSELHKSEVFDYDGSVLDDDSPHFYAPLRGRKDYQELGGRETWIWNDYFGEVNGYISRVWQTNDNGRTIRCICKNGETKTTDGKMIACCHFHDCALRESNGDLYITSGDTGRQCKLIKGRLIENGWQFDVLGEGNLFKFGTVLIDEPYLYFLCDYTGYGNTGILKVSFSDAGNIERYQYVFTCQDNRPLSKVYYLNNYSFIIYDGSVNGRMLISYKSEQYKNLYVAFEKEPSSIAALSTQNNAGLVLIQKAEGYYISDLKLNDYMYDFTEAMEEAGYRDFRFVQ